jgi:hypothetical protein
MLPVTPDELVVWPEAKQAVKTESPPGFMRRDVRSGMVPSSRWEVDYHRMMSTDRFGTVCFLVSAMESLPCIFSPFAGLTVKPAVKPIQRGFYRGRAITHPDVQPMIGLGE